MPHSSATPAAGWRAVPRTVWALGFVSLFMEGAALLLASLLAGFLWESAGSAATFLCGAALAAVALVALLVLVRRDA